MATRQINTRLAVDGETEYKRAMTEVNAVLKEQKSDLKLLEAEFKGRLNTTEALTQKEKLLNDEIAQQDAKVKSLEQAVKDAAVAYGENDKRVSEWKISLNTAKRELIAMNENLDDTKKYLKEAEESADGAAKSIDGFGKEVKDMDGADKTIGDLASQFGNLKNMILGGAIVTGIKEFAGAVLELEESTREYRQIMGTLEVSSQAAGYSAEQTAETYQLLQSVLGDTQTAATATANLQALGLEQETLMAVTYGAIGAWATYGDSIPIDGLSEAINETIKAGQVTGTFADVLNWAGISEDEFNEKLANCTTEAEKVGAVLRVLGKEDLPNLGREWVNANQDIVQANQAQERLNESMGRLGETVAPLANAIREFGADAIDWLVDKIERVIPVLEGMAEAARWAWDAITGGKETDVYKNTQYGSRRVDGTHASGLAYVPFDGYLAELHAGEAVLTAAEADWWRSMGAGAPAQSVGISATDMERITAAAVNALVQSRGQEQINVTAKWSVNGREFYADTIDDLRAVSKSNPEVTDD